ncbi:hypothetical protein OG322_21010 [Streptomyces sp. NBC_01260]|uniref:hypothetical protein n=1 Tax=unclassified Streptomyces TaxID=2593676 RepID=UPI000F54D6A8|nr:MULTISPECIES: hypothetical protein [unclassified Streptomyces]RPK49251.1 hypothetical protein EES39_08360 [Streptomyces sp. ADI92-24]
MSVPQGAVTAGGLGEEPDGSSGRTVSRAGSMAATEWPWFSPVPFRRTVLVGGHFGLVVVVVVVLENLSAEGRSTRI